MSKAGTDRMVGWFFFLELMCLKEYCSVILAFAAITLQFFPE